MSKKLTNDVRVAVEDCLAGQVAVHPGQQLLEGHRVVIRADVDAVAAAAVTLVSGGGSGHEPAHAGYVGGGMLSAAVAGSVFASPPPSSILAAVQAVASPKGTVLIIKNYTGDRLNFGIAAERAKAAGQQVEMVVVGEDCALTSTDKTAGRRGLAGTVFVHKIAGALSAKGSSLQEVATVCREAAANMGTIGLSLSPCSVPGSGPSFQLPEELMELGLGIHGEAGVRRMKVLSAKDAVDAMFSHMTKEDSVTRFSFQAGDSLALMVNNLGGTSVLELNIVAKEAIEWLESRGARVDRAYCGSYMTSLEMAGVSLSLLKLNDVIKDALDSPCSAPGWQVPLYRAGQRDRVTPQPRPCRQPQAQAAQDQTGATVDEKTAALLHHAVSYACEAVGNCERQLNQLDSQSGDGDCGATLKRGTDAIRSALGPASVPGLPVSCPQRLLLALAAIVEQDMGGSSGALYSLCLSAAAGPLGRAPSGWPAALRAGLDAVMKYGGAAPGDRTMVDALHAASEAVSAAVASGGAAVDVMQAAAQAAEQAALATAEMRAGAGRASYVSAEHLTQPDPGAHAVGIALRAVCEAAKLQLQQ